MKVFDTKESSAAANMAFDAQLLQGLAEEELPIVHHYGWSSPSLTYGHFVKPWEYLSEEGIAEVGLDIAKRPTGGGLIFHTSDLAFSFFLPASHRHFSLNTMDNYAFVNSAVAQAVKLFIGEETQTVLLPDEPKTVDEFSLRFCMAHPTRYDVMLEGRKVGGAAQRRTRDGYLHHGSICLTVPSSKLLEKVLLGTHVAEAMGKHSYPLLGTSATEESLANARIRLQQLITQTLKAALI